MEGEDLDAMIESIDSGAIVDVIGRMQRKR
jgi:hypothetical protein